MAKTRYLENLVNGTIYPTRVDAINAGAIANMHRQYNATKNVLLDLGIDVDDTRLAQSMYNIARLAIIDVIRRQLDKTNTYPDIVASKSDS